MRTADSGFAINPSRTISVRLKKRKTLPSFSNGSLFGISSFQSIDANIKPMTADNNWTLYDIKVINNAILRVMNDHGSTSYKDKLSYFYKSASAGWTSWQRTSTSLYPSSSPFVVIYSGSPYIGYFNSSNYLSFIPINSDGSLGQNSTTNFQFDRLIQARSCVVSGTTYIVGISKTSVYGPYFTYQITLLKVNSLTNVTELFTNTIYIHQTEKITSLDVEQCDGKIYLFTASNDGNKGIYFLIDPIAYRVSEPMPVLPIEFKKTGDDWMYFRPHKVTAMTGDNGETQLFVVGEMFKNNIYIRRNNQYVPGESILLFAYGKRFFTTTRESFIEARTKEYFYNSAKLVKIDSSVYLIEIGRPVLVTQMVPLFGTTPYTTLSGIYSYSISHSENDMAGLVIDANETLANAIEVMDEIVLDVGYDGKYVSIGKFDVYGISEAGEIADPKSFRKQYQISAISSGLGRAFTYVSDAFYELWGADTINVGPSNYKSRVIIKNGPLSPTQYGIMFDESAIAGNMSAMPLLEGAITHSRFYDVIANFAFPYTAPYEIEISPAGYTAVDDIGNIVPSGLTYLISGTPSSSGQSCYVYQYINRINTQIYTTVPQGDNSLSIRFSYKGSKIEVYKFDSNTKTWQLNNSFTIPSNYNADNEDEGYSSALVGFRVRYDVSEKTVYGNTFGNWSGGFPFLNAIYDNTGNRYFVTNPCFVFSNMHTKSLFTDLPNGLSSDADQRQTSSLFLQFIDGSGSVISIYPRLKIPLQNGQGSYTVNLTSGQFWVTTPSDVAGTSWPVLINGYKLRYNARIDKDIFLNAFGNSFDGFKGKYTMLVKLNYPDQSWYYAIAQIMGTLAADNVYVYASDPNNVYLFCILTSTNETHFKANPSSITFYPIMVVGRVVSGDKKLFEYGGAITVSEIGGNSQRRGFILPIKDNTECFRKETTYTIVKANIGIKNVVISSKNKPLSILEAADYLFHLSGVTNVVSEYLFNGNKTGAYYDYSNQLRRSSAKISYYISSASSLSGKRVGIFNGLTCSSDSNKYSGYLVTATNDSLYGYLELYEVKIDGANITETLVYRTRSNRFSGEIEFYTSESCTAVVIGGVLEHIFGYERITSNNVYDTNSIMAYITSGFTVSTKLSTVDDVLDYYAVDMGMDGATNYGSLVSERRIYVRDTQNGGIYLYRNAQLIDNSANPIDAVEITRQSESDMIYSHIRAEGNDAIEIIDEQLSKTYGRRFMILPTVNVDGIGNLLNEANLTIRDLSNRSKSYKIISGADPRIEVGDKMYFKVISGGIIQTKLLRIVSTNMYGSVQGNECSFDMEVEGYEEL